jgi:hypothetical protein
MWYGSLQTPSKQHPNQLTYDPSHVFHGSLMIFALAVPTALVVAALREGVTRPLMLTALREGVNGR